MDSDGYVDEVGRCEFVNTREDLADAVVELAASLGLRPVKRKKRVMLDGVDCGPAFQVKFTPDIPVFRLKRKLARHKAGTVPRVPGHRRRATGPRAGRCGASRWRRRAACSSSGRRYIPTHNCSSGAARTADPQHRRLHRPRLHRPHHAGAVQRGQRCRSSCTRG